MPNEKYAHFKDFSGADRTFDEKKKVWLDISENLTEEQFDAMMARSKERQALVPAVGTMAPDFTLERVSRDRKRTGDFVTLSELKGKPVALCFGSYT
jgi:cytochrome oxidase Cu insertion factor (SCO1/SenC/PrrC family)